MNRIVKRTMHYHETESNCGRLSFDINLRFSLNGLDMIRENVVVLICFQTETERNNRRDHRLPFTVDVRLPSIKIEACQRNIRR